MASLTIFIPPNKSHPSNRFNPTFHLYFIENTNTISNPALVAEIISREAEKYSNLRDYLSPFAESAIAHNKNYWGGKPDDITVVVSQINLAKAETIENYFE